MELVILLRGCHKLFISTEGRIGFRRSARNELVSRGTTRRHSSHAETSGKVCTLQIFGVALGQLLDVVSLWRCRGCPRSLELGEGNLVRSLSRVFPLLCKWDRRSQRRSCLQCPSPNSTSPTKREAGLHRPYSFRQSEVASNQFIGRHWLTVTFWGSGATVSSSIKRG